MIKKKKSRIWVYSHRSSIETLHAVGFKRGTTSTCSVQLQFFHRFLFNPSKSGFKGNYVYYIYICIYIYIILDQTIILYCSLTPSLKFFVFFGNHQAVIRTCRPPGLPKHPAFGRLLPDLPRESSMGFCNGSRK